MSEHPGANPPTRRGGPADDAHHELVRVRASELQAGEPLPMNFIVLPQEEEAAVAAPDGGDHVQAAPQPPHPDELPVLTVRAEPPDDALADAAADQSTSDPFQPTVFGPRLRQPHEHVLHADPDSAPASVAASGARASRKEKKKKSAGLLWAVVVLLLLAAAAWWWIDRHGLVWPFAARIA